MSKQKTIIKDLTQGSVTRLLLIFAFPILCSNLLQTVYNMVDMVVVGQFVGSEGLSAVSIGADIQHCLMFLAMGISNAGQVILSQYIGAGDRTRIKGTIGTMFTLCLGCAVVLSVLCLAFLDPLLQVLNTPAESYEYAREYSVVCIGGVIFIYGYNLVSSILRGMGDSKRPFLFVAVASIVNLILDLIFVAALGWGPMGAALATVIGQGISFIWALIYLYKNREAFGFDFRLRSFKPDPVVLPKLIKLGLPMALQSAAIHLSMLVVNAYINAYGVIASAVTGVGNKLNSLTSVVCNALSTAGSTMVGQNLGGKKFERIPKIIRISLFIGLSYAIVLSLFTVFFPEVLFGFFNSEPEVLAMALTYVPVAVMLYTSFALRSPFFALINGSGNSLLNLIVGLLDGVVCRIGLALLLGLALDMGIMGFWIGNAAAGYVPFIVGFVYYLSGTWKKSRVVKD